MRPRHPRDPPLRQRNIPNSSGEADTMLRARTSNTHRLQHVASMPCTQVMAHAPRPVMTARPFMATKIIWVCLLGGHASQTQPECKHRDDQRNEASRPTYAPALARHQKRCRSAPFLQHFVPVEPGDIWSADCARSGSIRPLPLHAQREAKACCPPSWSSRGRLRPSRWPAARTRVVSCRVCCVAWVFREICRKGGPCVFRSRESRPWARVCLHAGAK